MIRSPSNNGVYPNTSLEANPHPRPEKSRCVSPGRVGGMNGNFDIRPNLDTLRETKSVERLKHALMVIGGRVRFTVSE